MAEPEFLRTLTPAIKECLRGDEAGEFSFIYTHCPEDDQYTIKVYPAPLEVFGGDKDGSRVWESFSLDVARLIRLFDHPPAVDWHSTQPDEVSTLRIVGSYQNQTVVICVGEDPPSSIEPRLVLDWATQKIRAKKVF